MTAGTDPPPAEAFAPYDPDDEIFFGARAVVEGEYEAIRLRRRGQGEDVDAGPAPPPLLTGLALSGGGIRSASFCLGVLQALAHAGWLRRVDYLSTVSGGGYIGASLTWLLHKTWQPGSQDADAGGQAPRFGVGHADFPYGLYPVGGTAVSPPSSYRGRLLRYLRQNGRYLTPGGGLNGLALAAVLLRNSLFSLALYGGLLLLLFLLLGPWLFETPARAGWPAWSPWPSLPLVLNLAALPAVLFLVSIPLYAVWTVTAHVPGARRQYAWRRSYEIAAGVVLALTLALLLLGTLPGLHRWLTTPAVPAAQPLKQFVVEPAAPGAAGAPPRVTVRELPPAPAPGQTLPPAWWAALTGGSSALLGVLSSLLAFVRTQTGAAPGARRGVTTALVVVGTAALVLGVLLLAYDGRVRLDAPLADTPALRVGVAALGIALLMLVGLWVNTNYLSVHRYYRDRLMETFMPDVQEVLELHGVPGRVAHEADAARLHELWPPREEAIAPGPYPIINANVVLVSSRIPKFRGRGGDNFVLSPRFCGSNATGWAPTATQYHWMTLSSAMAISGAAVNPNTAPGGQGLTRQPLLSFLMGLLNVRLGYWLLNPMPRADRLDRLEQQRRGRWLGRAQLWLAERLSPRVPNAIWPGLSELVLRSDLDENSHMLQLSDGGHFENLGLYELVRRRLPLIIACDAGADAGYTFGDLANAIEKVRADFGAIIEIEATDLERLTPRHAQPGDAADGLMRHAERGFLVARITYPVQGGQPHHGTLIYLTTTFFRELSADLYGYRRTNPAFPDQPTTDQFFDERQFDAYRELGYQTAWQMLQHADVQSDRRVLARMGPPPWRPPDGS